jgi:peptidoglycan/xylan/chitin deacetylase (PgdA/CDA1 family)
MQRAVSLLIGLALLFSASPSAEATERQGARSGVAFTFDDGMSARGIREVLAVAVAERTPVTFFPTALSLKRFPQIWREISAAGFAIGNHTDGHRSLTLLLATSGEVAVRAAITGWREAARTIGINVIPYLRPPYGERNTATDRVAVSVGITHVLNWGATFADTAPRCSGTIAKRIAHATSGGEGVIVLAHTGAKGRAYEPMTARIFAQVIASYRARDITPVSLDTMFGAPKRVIDWTLAALATSAPAQLGQPRVPTAAPAPYREAELKLSPGAAAGVCG